MLIETSIFSQLENAESRGIAVTADGCYNAINSVPAKKSRGSSVVFIQDLETLKAVGCVTGVGDEAHFQAVVSDDPL